MYAYGIIAIAVAGGCFGRGIKRRVGTTRIAAPDARCRGHIARQVMVFVFKKLNGFLVTVNIADDGLQLRGADQRLADNNPADNQPDGYEHNRQFQGGKSLFMSRTGHTLPQCNIFKLLYKQINY